MATTNEKPMTDRERAENKVRAIVEDLTLFSARSRSVIGFSVVVAMEDLRGRCLVGCLHLPPERWPNRRPSDSPIRAGAESMGEGRTAVVDAGIAAFVPRRLPTGSHPS